MWWLKRFSSKDPENDVKITVSRSGVVSVDVESLRPSKSARDAARAIRAMQDRQASHGSSKPSSFLSYRWPNSLDFVEYAGGDDRMA